MLRGKTGICLLIVLLLWALRGSASATLVEVYTSGNNVNEGVMGKNNIYLKGNGLAGSSCIYQIIDAGGNMVPDIPDNNGNASGDDRVIYMGYIGDDGIINKGSLWKEVNVKPGSKIFIRAWDDFSTKDAKYYGDSELFLVGAIPFPGNEKFDVHGKKAPAFVTSQTKE